MARSSLWSSRWVPEGSVQLDAPEANAVAYLYDAGTRVAAIGYSGKRNKPDFHNSYRTNEQRLAHLNKWRKNLADTLAFKAEQKAKRKARNGKGHDIPIGAIFNFSWGYEQTNQNFYQVVSVTKCTVDVREIGSELVDGMDTGPMAGHVVAVPDSFIGEPQRKRVQFTPDGRPYLSMASYGWCDLWDGKPEYCSWYH